MKRFLLASVLAVIVIAGGCRWDALPDGGSGYINDGSLQRLRACESGGNYGAVSSTGRYRGAYQFSQATWNSTARSWAPFLVGVDPARAGAADQDNMARGLFAQAGRSPWPHCGRYI